MHHRDDWLAWHKINWLDGKYLLCRWRCPHAVIAFNYLAMYLYTILYKAMFIFLRTLGENTLVWVCCAMMFYPCLFCPSDNVWRSWRAHLSIDLTPSWITQQISVEKCENRGVSARRERQTVFKIVTWIKQTWIIHQCTLHAGVNSTKSLVKLVL